MATRKISTTIELDGAQKFKSDLDSAARAVSQLGSQMRLADASFRATGDAQEYMRSRGELLTQQIAQQEEVVRAMEGALATMVKQHGEGSKEADQWQQKLTRARTALVNMQHDLDNNSRGLDKNGQAIRDMGAAAEEASGKAGELSNGLANIGKGINLTNLRQGLEGVSRTLDNIAKAALNAAKAVWDWQVGQSEWADELQTTSLQTGINTTDLQTWSYAARFVDTEVSTIQQSMVRMTRNMSSSSKDVAAAWKTLGVNIRDSTGGLRDSQLVFWDAITALGQIENATERDSIAMTLFGRSAQELNPLIAAGRDTWESYVEEAKKLGLVLSEQEVGKLTDFNDSYQRLQATLDAASRRAASAVSPAFSTLADNIAKCAGKFNSFLESEEGQQTLTMIAETISGLATDYFGEDGAIYKFFDDLPGNMENVKSTVSTTLDQVKGYIGAFLVADVVVKLGTVGTNIASIVTGLHGGTAAGGAAATASGGALGAGLGAIAGTAGGIALVAAGLGAIGWAVNDTTNENLRTLGARLQQLKLAPDAASTARITAAINQGVAQANKTVELTAQITTTYVVGRRLLKSFLPGEGAGDSANQLVEQEYKTLEEWVEQTVDPTITAAEERLATLTGDTTDLQTTLGELESTKSELLLAMQSIYKNGRSATAEEIENVENLLTKVELLQKRVAVLSGAGYQEMKNAYQTTINGHGTEHSQGLALDYIEFEYNQSLLNAEEAYGKANTTYEAAMAQYAEGTAEYEAAKAEYEQAQSDYSAAVTAAETTRNDMLNLVMEGVAKANGMSSEDLKSMGDLYKIIAAFSGIKTGAEAAEAAKTLGNDFLSRMFPDIDFGEGGAVSWFQANQNGNIITGVGAKEMAEKMVKQAQERLLGGSAAKRELTPAEQAAVWISTEQGYHTKPAEEPTPGILETNAEADAAMQAVWAAYQNGQKSGIFSPSSGAYATGANATFMIRQGITDNADKYFEKDEWKNYGTKAGEAASEGMAESMEGAGVVPVVEGGETEQAAEEAGEKIGEAVSDGIQKKTEVIPPDIQEMMDKASLGIATEEEYRTLDTYFKEHPIELEVEVPDTSWVDIAIEAGQDAANASPILVPMVGVMTNVSAAARITGRGVGGTGGSSSTSTTYNSINIGSYNAGRTAGIDGIINGIADNYRSYRTGVGA